MLSLILNLLVYTVGGTIEYDKIPQNNDVIVIEKYLERKQSPLVGHGGDFVYYATRYGVDPVVIVSISGVESGYGKHECGAFNPFGYGVPCYNFASYTEAIKAVSRQIGTSKIGGYTKYRESGDIQDLANVYNGGDREKWRKDVEYFYREIWK